MSVEKDLDEAQTQMDKLDVLSQAIRKGMFADCSKEEYGEARFALGYLVAWLKGFIGEL